MKFPLSANQTKLFRHYKLFSSDPSYNQVFLYKIGGDFEPVRFKRAIEKAYNSIDQFKVHFEESAGGPNQIFFESRKYEVEIVEPKSGESIESFREKMMEQVSKVLNASIHLSNWPLVQFTLFCFGNEEHYLFLSAPHIITDGFSYTRLIEKINEAYRLPSIESDREKIILSSLSNSETDLEFFSQELCSIDSFELKAIQQKRNERGALDGIIHYFEIEKNSLKQFLNRHKFSESSFFLSIHALFLKKLCDEEHIVIGLPVLNRNKSNKKSIGFFVNTLPLAINFKEIHTLESLIETINKKIMRLLRHQSFDVGQLKKFNTKFNNYFTYYPEEFNYSVENCHFERIYLKRNGVGSEFTFTVENRKDHWMLTIESGKFFHGINVPKIVETMIGHVIEENSSSIHEIPLIQKELDSYKTYDRLTTAVSAFEKIAQLQPKRIALNDFSSKLSYEELDAKSNRVARFIDQYDAKYVIISLSKTNDLIVLILGILKAGKCYIPIDKFCPPDRFKTIISQFDAPLIIGDKDLETSLQIPLERFIAMETLLFSSYSLSSSPLKLPMFEDDPAYIIFTSGTTGRPKGVPISYLNLMSLISACFEKFSFSHSDVWTLFHSYSFDFSVWEIFGCLFSGGTLLVIDTQTAKLPASFYSILSKYKVTVLNQTPTSFKELIRIDEQEKMPLSLRYVIFGGEALCFTALEKWIQRHPLQETKLINMYGITETTIHVTYYEIREEDLKHKHSIIGKPLSNLRVQIVNSEGQSLPDGIPGEIAICGDGVSSGYYKAPDMTEKKFVFNNAKRFYLSGDLARFNSNRDLVFLGRKDRQVQIRGFRVELDEIEFHIMQTELVEQCAIDALLFENDATLRIVAYLIPKQLYRETRLKEHLAKSLPFYMIPAIYSYVDRIPLTINGKVDLKSLRGSLKMARTKELGMTVTERGLKQIISETIRNGNFSIYDNFWDIGVTSIDVATIFFKIKRLFDIELSMAALFQYTSIQKLSGLIDQQTTQQKVENG